MRRRTESKTKKRMSAEDRKKAILETTVSFISQFGFWGFTIRDVAQAPYQNRLVRTKIIPRFSVIFKFFRNFVF